MESQKKDKYEVIITDPAEIAFYEILDYLYEHYAVDQAEKMANSLRDTAKSLNDQPKRGSIENKLIDRSQEYRYILFRRVPRAEIKILYFVNILKKIVYVTDFFPTEMDDKKISKRN